MVVVTLAVKLSERGGLSWRVLPVRSSLPCLPVYARERAVRVPRALARGCVPLVLALLVPFALLTVSTGRRDGGNHMLLLCGGPFRAPTQRGGASHPMAYLVTVFERDSGPIIWPFVCVVRQP